MVASSLPIPPIWHALAPEINTARLMTGAGPEPMLQAASAWTTLALELETQADELAGALSALSAAWSGSASERAVQATMPMVIWLRTTSAQCLKRGLQASAQATAYATAMAATPPIPEIEQNHITHAVLEATNFFGVNAVPIGLNETDYFVRMWNQAAAAMDAYQADTAINTLFEPIPPMTPIVIPGVGEATAAAGVAGAAALGPGAAMREAAIAHVGAQATVESAGLQAGRAASSANQAATSAETQARRADDPRLTQQQPGDQLGQQGMQMMSQIGSTLGQIPQQAGQMLQSPMQQLTQPLQQVSQLFSQVGQMGSGNSSGQVGLLGASPFSNHPLAGGSGAASGAGLVRAASLPGAGGLSSRTSLLAELVGQQGQVTPTGMAGAAAGAGGAGLAPVGAGGGGMGGMGHMGQRGTSGGSREGLVAPAPLDHDFDDDDDDW
jgi:PPE-repeat protein